MHAIAPDAAHRYVSRAGVDRPRRRESWFDDVRLKKILVWYSVAPVRLTRYTLPMARVKMLLLSMSRISFEVVGMLSILILAPIFCWSISWFALPTATSVAFVCALASWAIALYFLTCGTHQGPLTPGGKRPSYPDNGLLYITATIGMLFVGDHFDWWPATLPVDTLEGSILLMNTLAIVICVVLLLTGRKHGHPPDDGTLGDGWLRDFYSGVWLHPRLCGIDLKLLINSRFSMTWWILHSIAAIVVAIRSPVLDWGVFWCATSQILYLSTFFWQESHYVHTIDIIEDRAGFYETWGCLVWVPAVYTLHTRIGLRYGSGLEPSTALCVFLVGALAWVCNVWANEQRRGFRKRPSKPICCSSRVPLSIRAEYTVVQNGEPTAHHNYLLVDGWWGMARHPQYIFDIIQSFTWGILGGGVTTMPLALFYPVYITILLVHRVFRDERRCMNKYGEYYTQYKMTVRWRLIPGVF